VRTGSRTKWASGPGLAVRSTCLGRSGKRPTATSSPADQNRGEHLDVLFDGVLAVKLRLSYRPLTLHPADPDIPRRDPRLRGRARPPLGPGPLPRPADPARRTRIHRLRPSHHPGHTRWRPATLLWLDRALPRDPHAEPANSKGCSGVVQLPANTEGPPTPTMPREPWYDRPALARSARSPAASADPVAAETLHPSCTESIHRAVSIGVPVGPACRGRSSGRHDDRPC
jgi:hypothetical protein